MRKTAGLGQPSSRGYSLHTTSLSDARVQQLICSAGWRVDRAQTTPHPFLVRSPESADHSQVLSLVIHLWQGNLIPVHATQDEAAMTRCGYSIDCRKEGVHSPSSERGTYFDSMNTSEDIKSLDVPTPFDSAPNTSVVLLSPVASEWMRRLLFFKFLQKCMLYCIPLPAPNCSERSNFLRRFC